MDGILIAEFYVSRYVCMRRLLCASQHNPVISIVQLLTTQTVSNLRRPLRKYKKAVDLQ